MSIRIDQWHASIGLLCGLVYKHIRMKLSIGCCGLKVVIIMLFFFSGCFFLLLLKYGDVGINPGPKENEARFHFLFSL